MFSLNRWMGMNCLYLKVVDHCQYLTGFYETWWDEAPKSPLHLQTDSYFGKVLGVDNLRQEERKIKQNKKQAKSNQSPKGRTFLPLCKLKQTTSHSSGADNTPVQHSSQHICRFPAACNAGALPVTSRLSCVVQDREMSSLTYTVGSHMTDYVCLSMLVHQLE